MKTIKLTKVEERALITLLECNPCEGSCAFSEMQKSKKDCDECKLTHAISSIENKLGLYD